MINNAFDIFNTAEASITFCQTTVAKLREALVADQINKSEEPKLDQAEALAYDKSAKELIQRLETVKTEIRSRLQIQKNGHMRNCTASHVAPGTMALQRLR